MDAALDHRLHSLRPRERFGRATVDPFRCHIGPGLDQHLSRNRRADERRGDESASALRVEKKAKPVVLTLFLLTLATAQ